MDPQKNIIETALDAAAQPSVIIIQDRPHALVPHGWDVRDLEKLLDHPQRTTGIFPLDDTGSFIAFVKRYRWGGSLIYCAADFDKGNVVFTAVLNDHCDAETEMPGWRDLRAVYAVKPSLEWKRWSELSGKAMPQADFAAFLEDNLKDVAQVDGSPTGADMLALALNFEASQDSQFKQAVRLQSGGIEMAYINQEDETTLRKMKVFERFTLGLAPFFNGAPYELGARLKYRINAGKLSLWYELIRPDLVVQAATRDLVTLLIDQTGLVPLYGRTP
jgi:uncharacterized protein YfdQ (DUF2303 family)